VSGFATGISSPVDLKVSTDGALYYLARGAGAVGKIEYPGIADSVPPTVSITNPTPGSIVARKSTIIISATATDNVGVTRVEFYVNGSLQCSDSSAGYTCNWKVPSPPNRTYQIEARAFDQAGNSGSALVQVTSR
jgi:streptogramin lyase